MLSTSPLGGADQGNMSYSPPYNAIHNISIPAESEVSMGAQAVGIGRPYLWGLGAFGQEGVERVLEIVRTETRAAM